MFETEDPGEFQAFVEQAAPGARISADEGATFYAGAEVRLLPRSAILKIDTANMRASIDRPAGYLGFTVPLNARCEVATGGGMRAFETGEAHILHADGSFKFQQRHSGSLFGINFFPELLESFVAKLNGECEGPEVRFPDRLSFHTPAGRSLWRYLGFLWSEVSRGSGAMRSPLAAKEYEAMLLALLAVAIDEQSNDAFLRIDDDSSPAKIRHAEDFIAANLGAPLSLSDIANATGIPVRSLTRAFHKRHGIGPITYLRQLRLEQIHRELIGADPMGCTVTEIALKYGFENLGRFAQQYRAAFKELPSTTLKAH